MKKKTLKSKIALKKFKKIRTDLNSYEPSSLLSAISKVFESVPKDHIVTILDLHPSLNYSQQGFQQILRYSGFSFQLILVSIIAGTPSSSI